MLSFSSGERPTTVGVVGPSSVETAVRSGRETVETAVSVTAIGGDGDGDDDGSLETVDCVVAATRTDDTEQTDGGTPAATADVAEWAMETAAQSHTPPVVFVGQPDAPITEALQAGVAEFLPWSTLEQTPATVLQRAVQAAESATTAEYQTIYDNVSEPLTLHDPDTGELLHANRRLCELLGYSRSELIAMRVEEYTADLPGYDQESAMEIITSATETGSAGPVEWPLETANGEQVWVEATLTPVEVGGRELVLSTATDVTDRRRQRRQLEEITEHIDEVVYLARADLSEVLFVNEAYTDLFGQSTERVYEDPMAPLEVVHPEDRDAYRADLEAMSEHVRSGETEPFEFSHRLRVDGVTRWVSVTGYPSRGPGGDVDRVVGVIRDVTERRRREREYEQIFDSVNDAITVHDPETAEMVDANETFCSLLGYDRETVLEMDIDDFSRADRGYTTERGREFIQRIVDEETTDQIEWALETSEGETVWVEVHGTIAEIGGERRFVAIDRDITEAKRREREYEQIFDGVNDAIAVHDPKTGDILEVNDSYVELFGFDRETIFERGIAGLSATEEGYTDERARDLIRAVGETGTDETVEWRIETATGERRTIESKLTVAEIGGQRRVLSLIRDITERKRRAQEFEQIFNGIDDPVTIHDPETAEHIRINDGFCDLLGYSREEIKQMGIEGYSLTEEGYTAERAREFVHSVVEGEDPKEMEWVVETSEGERRWLQVKGTTAEIGGEQRFVSIDRDITERKRREREYEEIFDGVTDIIAVHDPETGAMVDVNETMCDLTGYDRETILNRGAEGLLVDDPNADYPPNRVPEIIDRVMRGEDISPYEQVIETSDGDRLWLEINPTRAVIGGEQRFLAISRDITERKRREREFEQIYNGVTDIITVYDPETGDLLDVNETMCELLGYDRETILELGPDGVSATELGYDRETVERVVSEVGETGQPATEIEWALRTASGETLWAEVNATPAEVNGKQRVLAIARDVTERRDREERVQVLNRVLRHNLRNDVDAVQAYATAIAEAATDEGVREHAERIWETADSLLELSAKARATEEMLREEAPRQTRPVETVVRRVVSESRDANEEATFDIDCGAARAPIEAGVFRLVMQELIENAVEHGGAEPHVQVRATTEGDAQRQVVEIVDDGPGIPDRALTPFRTGGETQLEHNQGLGLWLVNWGVRRLGGGIEFDRAEDGGTIVRLSVPTVDGWNVTRSGPGTGNRKANEEKES